MAIIESASILFGLGGLAVGAYSAIQSKRDSRRKTRLKQLSEKLDEVRSRMERVENLESPYGHFDTAASLDDIAKSVVAYSYENDENPRVILSGGLNDDVNINNGQQALDHYKQENDWVSVRLTLGDPNVSFNTYNQGINDHLFYLGTCYEVLDEIQEDYIDILEEFAPKLHEKIESHLDRMIKMAHGNVIKHSNGIEIDPEEYDTAKEIGEEIFRFYWYYDGINQDLRKLSKLIDEVEDSRTTILQASYS